MLRLPLSVLKPFLLTPSLSFQFSKIIKMAPLKTSQSSYPMMNSMKSVLQTFTEFGAVDPQKQNKLTASESTQSFMNFVADMNIETFEINFVTKASSIEVDQIYKKLQKEHIITNIIELLIAQKEFTAKTRDFITNFFTCQFAVIKKKILQGNLTEEDTRFLAKFMQQFHQYFVLLQLNDKLVINYLTLITFLINKRTLDENRSYFLNQKIVIDYLIEKDSKITYRKKDLIQVLQYISSSVLISNYGAKYYPFLKLIISKLPKDWYTDSIFDPKRFIKVYARANYDCEKLNKGVRYFMNQPITWTNIEVIVTAINCYINVKAQVFAGKPVPQEYLECLKRISKFIRQQKNPSKNNETKIMFSSKVSQKDWQHDIFKTLIPNLFRSSIWLEDIWFDFAEWLETGQNYKKVRMINLLSIFELMDIDKDIIPESVRERILKSKNFLLVKHNLRVQNIDLIKEYYRQFGERIKSFYTVQQQITNNLRSVSRKNVKSEFLIRIFLVDILIDNKVIIEINSQLHYIENDRGDEKISNLKSAFRKRILQKLGYKLLEYEIDSITEGNLQFLNHIQKELKKIETQGV